MPGTPDMSHDKNTMAANAGRGTKDLTDADLRLLVGRVKDYAIFMLDPAGKVASWNEGAERIKGYTAGEIIGKHMSTFYVPEDALAEHPAELLDRARRDGRVEEEGWRVRKDGTRFWADVIITALFNDSGELRGFAKVTRDLTERRNAELMLNQLSGRLMQIQDEERRRVSRELHDTTSPLLTSLTGKLYTARQRTRSLNPDLHVLVEEALALAEATATMVRTISSLLHPPLHEQAGLLPALRWYLDTVSNRSGVKVKATLPDTFVRLSREREIALFRTVQEWFTGSLAVGARAFELARLAPNGEAELIMHADGIAAAPTPGSELFVTVSAMRARLQQLEGTVVVTEEPGGLVLTARVPARPRDAVG
jgi:PAS domain S-box-containing protein